MKKAKAVLPLLLALLFIFMPTGPPLQLRRIGNTQPASPPHTRNLVHAPENPLEDLLTAASAWLQNQIATSVRDYGYLPSNIPNVYASSTFGITSTGSTNYPPTTGMEMTPHRVQGSARGTSTGSATSFTVTLGSAPTAGNTLILTFSSYKYNAGGGTPVTVSSITQTNVTWNSSASITETNIANSSNSDDSEIWATTSVGANAGTIITVNMVTGGSSFVLAVANVCEYSGLSSILDKTAVDNGSGGKPDTGTTGTTTAASELWIGSTTYTAGGAITQSSPTNGFALLDGTDQTNGSFHVSNGYLEYIAAATGSAGSGTSVNRDNNWSGCIATFKAASTGNNGATPQRVQGNARGTLAGQSGSSFTVTLGAAPTNGDVLILTFGSMKGSTPAVTIRSISESGVTWNSSATITEALGSIESEIWLGSVGASAAATITIKVNNSNPGCVSIANVVEYSGLSITADVTGVNNGTAGPPTSISTSSGTSVANELVVADIVLTGGNTVTQTSPTNNFNLLDGADVQLSTMIHISDAYLEYVATSTGTFSTGTSASHGSSWVACIATFKAATFKGASTEKGFTKGTRVQYTDVTGGAVSSFSFYVSTYTSGDMIVLALYDDSGGSPNHRLWYTSGTDPSGTGWYTVNESSGSTDNNWGGTLTNNAYYWFMWQVNSDDAIPSYAAGAANTGVYLAQSFGTLLSTFSGGTLTTENWSMYLTYSTSSSSSTVTSTTSSTTSSTSSQPIVTTTPSVAYVDSEGSVSFPQITNFKAVSVTQNLIQFNITGTLSLNPGSAVNMTLSPSGAQHMEISIIDRTEEVYVTSGQVASSQWFSLNNTLVIYSLTSTEWAYVSPTAPGPVTPALTGPGFSSDVSPQVLATINFVPMPAARTPTELFVTTTNPVYQDQLLSQP